MTPQAATALCLLLAATLWPGSGPLCPSPARAGTGNSGWILFAGHDGTSWDIWSVRPDGQEPHRLTSWPGDERRPALRQERLLYVNGRRQLELLDLRSGERRPLFPAGPGYQDQPAWLADGSILYVRYQVLPRDRSRIHLCRVTADDTGWEPPRLLQPPDRDRLFPAPDPSGRRIAFTEAVRTPQGLHEEIGITDLDSGQSEILTGFGADSLLPAWSPDGRQLLFCSNRAGNYDIWLLDLASRTTRRLTNHPAYDCDPAWSPDGTWFAFISSRQSGRRLWIKPVDGGPARLLADMPAMDPAWTDSMPGAGRAAPQAQHLPDPTDTAARTAPTTATEHEARRP